jgi:hypothetical protein
VAAGLAPKSRTGLDPPTHRATAIQARRPLLWLYHADRNSRWHDYDMAEATPNVNELMIEIDDDPTGIFWD